MEFYEACAILGVQPHGLTVESVKKSFKLKSLEVHPDRGGSSREFIKTKNAEGFLLEYLDRRTSFDGIGVQALGHILKGLLNTSVVRRKLTATLSQAMKAEVYPFHFNNEAFLVPLWERRSVYHFKSGLLVIDVGIDLPPKVTLHPDNTLILEYSMALMQILQCERLSVNIGDFAFTVELDLIGLFASQRLLLSEDGIPRPGCFWEGSDSLPKASVYLNLDIV